MESQISSIRTPIPTTINTLQPTKRIQSMENLDISKRFKQEVHTATPKTLVNKTSTSDDEYADVQLNATQKQQHIRLESIITPTQTPLTTSAKQCTTCSIIIRANDISYNPMISDPKRYKGTCNHTYCDTCFQQLTCISTSNEFEWDGFPMINKRYRLKHEQNTIFSCSYCQMNL